MKLLLSSTVCLMLVSFIVIPTGCDRDPPDVGSDNSGDSVHGPQAIEEAPSVVMPDDPLVADLDSQTVDSQTVDSQTVDSQTVGNGEPLGSAEPAGNGKPSRNVMDFAALLAAGQEALQTGDNDAAYDYARWAMRLDANDPQVNFLMATILAERHRFPEAIAMLDSVAKTTPPARLPALGQTADWLVRYGNWSEAEVRYREILKVVPDAVLAHRSLAGLLIRQGRRVEAQSHLGRMCELGDIDEGELTSMLCVAFPLNGDEDAAFEPIGVLGDSRIGVSGGKWENVRAGLQKVESRDPWENALLGRAYAALSQWDSLESALEDAESDIDRSPDGWFAKGASAGHLGKHADAARCFAESVRLDPTDPIVYRELAKSLAQLNLPEAAEKTDARAELILSTHSIGKQLATDAGFDRQKLIELSEALNQLRRPLEALGWRDVWLAGSEWSESEKQAARDEIRRERERLVANEEATASREFVWCDVDFDKLVVPSLVGEK